MNWKQEKPNESGWYWAKNGIWTEIVYFEFPDMLFMSGCNGLCDINSVVLWGDKLEIPE